MISNQRSCIKTVSESVQLKEERINIKFTMVESKDKQNDFMSVAAPVTEAGMKLGSFAGEPGEIVGGVIAAPIGVVGGGVKAVGGAVGGIFKGIGSLF